MTPRNVITRAIVALVVLRTCGGWQSLAAIPEHDHPIPEKLGTVEFPSSCSSKVQKSFERAVALLHSFAYSAAEKEFGDIAAKDPTCAAPHWGLAMTYFHQLWEPPVAPQNIARGLSEIEQAKKLSSSDRERGFIDALSLIYANADSVPYRERLTRYAEAMRKLAERYPNDAECQIFHALALIASAPAGDASHAKYKDATAILEPLFKKYPQHPGIAHYLIHACDNPEMAQHGVAAAKAYSQIAPSAPHALHMPSHIYTRLGMWQESIASNLAAQKAAREQRDKGEELHAMDYLVYAYLQLGRDGEAARVVDQLRDMRELDGGDFKMGYAASAMPARYTIERRQWSDAAQLVPIDGAPPQVLAVTLWARSVGLARSGKAAAAQQEIEKLRGAYEKLRAAGDDYWATQVHVQMNEALAWFTWAQRKPDEALKLMRAAADEEDALEKRPVTPGAILPAREQLGDLLIEANHPPEAIKEFERALTMTPQRRGASMGLAHARDLVASAEPNKS